MPSEALSNLAKIGKIKDEPMNRAEIGRMLPIKNATSPSMKDSLKLRNQLLQSCSASLTN